MSRKYVDLADEPARKDDCLNVKLILINPLATKGMDLFYILIHSR